MPVDWVMRIISALGVGAGVVSGVMEARRKRMDLVGAVAVAFLTALGGGTLRDLLLGHTPVFWIRDENYAYLTLALTPVVFYSTRLLRLSVRSIIVPDALGLGAFTVMGVEAGLADGTSMFIASLMGVITGVFGGVLRDVICNEVPLLFKKDIYLYATCSLLGAWVYILATKLGWLHTLALPLAVAFVFILRLLAVRFNISLPEPRTPLSER
ncbi:predicted membrane protein [Longilinea arvoryzae]|uniref:Predicted membrane protein n=1 Tax=Longilinea arvoryzae TaxID=360412 RepID=A0A0S7BB56_9CHLR|nr:trimeric intracellular cation channel family protein [Longilinea arvoryzae]GAP12429.1 predicted membrane protein [Longilinea arvoryzae]